jgi:2-oxoglutarate ferredoxin oxidoreductase subunit delta
MGKIRIDKEKCKSCGLCIIYCPNDCIVMSDKINKRGVKPAVFKKGAKCTACTFCALICPDTAIEVFREKKSKKKK